MGRVMAAIVGGVGLLLVAVPTALGSVAIEVLGATPRCTPAFVGTEPPRDTGVVAFFLKRPPADLTLPETFETDFCIANNSSNVTAEDARFYTYFSPEDHSPLQRIGDLAPATGVLVRATVSPAPRRSETTGYGVAADSDTVFCRALFASRCEAQGSYEVDFGDDYEPPPPLFSPPGPLLAAHGIRSDAAAMNEALRIADVLVPGLASRSLSSETDGTGGVWDNAATLIADAENLTNTYGQRVRLLGHSKGGLDARAAIALRPKLFANLGMLATPNGGTRLAEHLCWAQRVPSPVIGGGATFIGFGDCTGPEDALWWLQRGQAAEFSRQAGNPDAPEFVVAGDCGTFSPFDGQARCHDGNIANLCGLLGDNGDGLVCTDSAFARSAFRGGGGDHLELSPTFDLDHSEMRFEPCPVSRVMAPLYGARNRGNPWIGGEGEGCGELGGGGGEFIFRSSGPQADSGATAQAVDPFAGQEAAEQSPRALVAEPGIPALFVIDPEGGDAAVALVLVPAGVAAAVEVTDDAGDPVSGVEVTLADGESAIGEQVYVVSMTGLSGAARRLTVSTDAAAAVAVATSVAASGVRAEADIVPASGPGAPSTISARLAGVPASEASAYVASARVIGPTGLATIPLPAASGGPDATFSSSTVLRAGDYTPIDISIEGPRSRTITSGATIPDAEASLTGLQSDALVDTDADGVADTLRLRVGLDVDTPDDYFLTADLRDPSGRTLTSVLGEATLTAGAGVVTLEVPTTQLLALGASGPFTLADAYLARGPQHRKVAVSAGLGTTSGAYPVGALPITAPTLSAPSAEVGDADEDGLLDQLAFSSTVSVPADGPYELRGMLVGPSGGVIEQLARPVVLEAGRRLVTLEVDGAHIVAGGSGRYQLVDLRLVPIEAPNLPEAEGGVGFTAPLDAADWEAADYTAPALTLTTPADGASLVSDQVATADYSCQEEAGGSGLADCTGTVASGAQIDTAGTGTRAFTVQTRDRAGNLAAAAATYTLGPRQLVSPVLECVVVRVDGTLRARFGYQNPNPAPVRIPIGPRNRFTPAPESRAQPTVFATGRQANVFEADLLPLGAWQLDGALATPGLVSPICVG